MLFHASIEQERGVFDLDDVADAECRKLISRHPHVFGDVSVSGVGEELSLWEDLKRAEKQQRSAADAMDGVCRTLPGLWRAEKILKKVGHSVPDNADAGTLLREIRTDADRLESARDEEERRAAVGAEERKAALGELLFDAVYAARHLEVDPEEALHARCEEQIRRFRALEAESGR